jgi:hypothetical protein
METVSNLRSMVEKLWREDRPLTFVGLSMLVVLAANAVGLIVDTRLITGAPAWLKPAKFAVSTSIYSFTFAWVLTHLTEWPRVRRFASWTTALVFVGEVAIIDLQAWRGTSSHFNMATLLDAVLFQVMGMGIALQTVAAGMVTYAIWRQTIGDRRMATALRAGLVISLLGASIGGAMTVPTSTQIAELRESGRMVRGGAHTVGAPDGGPGLPGTGWSVNHGDLRVPHFVGLHAIQLLPLVALWTRRIAPDARAIRLIRTATVSYVTLLALLLLQAVRGESLVVPGLLTSWLFVLWALTTVAAVWAASRQPRGKRVDPMFAEA